MKTRCSSGLMALVLALGMATWCAGCAWSVGGKGGERHLTPTQGQELIDLKKALDQGAISEEEYQKMKQAIILQ